MTICMSTRCADGPLGNNSLGQAIPVSVEEQAVAQTDKATDKATDEGNLAEMPVS